MSDETDFVALGGLLKATPQEDGGRRFLYFEASNEVVDHDDEVVLQKALAESADYFLRHGNIDISHYTILGPKSGVKNFMEYEIGKPIDAAIGGKRTFVKAELYQGESPMAVNANMVWDSLTKQHPPSRWYPSIGGAVLAKSLRIEPGTNRRVKVVEKVRWNNVALDRCPVNSAVPTVSTVPVGTLVKAMGGFVVKSLEAGYGTDVSALTGGGALRRQSLEGVPINYFDFRERMSSALVNKQVRAKSSALVSYAVEQMGMSHDEAAEFVERLMRDIGKNLAMFGHQQKRG